MLTDVDTGKLLLNARRSAGFSVRALAAGADVAGSTITRIQSGAMDPTVETLSRILAAAGYQVRIEAMRGRPRIGLGDVADAWTRDRGGLRLDWTRWRAFLDRLALHPELVPEAIFVPPPPSGELVVDALLAAVAEKLADDARLPRPSWTEAGPVLEEPFHPPTARRILGDVPPQLAARGLMIDSASLWRDRGSGGV
jgi:transcriptional regulator with XRE-family HTH domain